jgi:hypothetical protein
VQGKIRCLRCDAPLPAGEGRIPCGATKRTQTEIIARPSRGCVHRQQADNTTHCSLVVARRTPTWGDDGRATMMAMALNVPVEELSTASEASIRDCHPFADVDICR